MKNFDVLYAIGKLSEQDVNGFVNSSNSYLILGSGSACDTRDAGGYLASNDNKYWNLVRKASDKNPVLGKVLEHIHSNGRQPSKAQLERLEYLEKRGFEEMELGDAAIFSSGDLSKKGGKADYVCDAPGMTYRWEIQPNPPVITATFNSVMDSLYKSLMLFAGKKCKRIGIPKDMCTRKGGLDETSSSMARHAALTRFDKEKTSVKEVVIVGTDYSTSSKER
jgi:O-acetyl-ADP-ribose deacetylase (regulator of RNase III)